MWSEAAGETPKNNIRFLGFNQDTSRLFVGTTEGSQTYRCEAGKAFELMYDKVGQGTMMMEMLFSSCLVAHVGAGEGAASSQRCLRIINTRTEKLIQQINYPSAVLAVKLNRDRLVVVLETTIYIYGLRDLKQLHTIDGTFPNPKGICALSCTRDPNGTGVEGSGANNYLAYPGEDGKAFVYDVWHQKLIEIIAGDEAHNAPIAAMAFSPNGDKLATACHMGTLILVFSTPGKQILYQFRRGQLPCAIFSMSFSADAEMLCVSSDHQSVHVFKLDNGGGAGGAAAEAADGSGYLGGLMTFGQDMMQRGVDTLSSVLPQAVTDPMKGLRAFAKATLPTAGAATLCSISNVGVGPAGEREVLVVTYDGFLYRFLVPAEGSDCTCTSTHSLAKDHIQPAAPAGGGETAPDDGGSTVTAAVAE